jgi:hypothetical protein
MPGVSKETRRITRFKVWESGIEFVTTRMCFVSCSHGHMKGNGCFQVVMKGAETSATSIIQCLLHSALLTRYTAVVEKLPMMHGAARLCVL